MVLVLHLSSLRPLAAESCVFAVGPMLLLRRVVAVFRTLFVIMIPWSYCWDSQWTMKQVKQVYWKISSINLNKQIVLNCVLGNQRLVVLVLQNLARSRNYCLHYRLACVFRHHCEDVVYPVGGVGKQQGVLVHVHRLVVVEIQVVHQRFIISNYYTNIPYYTNIIIIKYAGLEQSLSHARQKLHTQQSSQTNKKIQHQKTEDCRYLLQSPQH